MGGNNLLPCNTVDLTIELFLSIGVQMGFGFAESLNIPWLILSDAEDITVESVKKQFKESKSSLLISLYKSPSLNCSISVSL
jgi:hypothetical protein